MQTKNLTILILSHLAAMAFGAYLVVAILLPV